MAALSLEGVLFFLLTPPSVVPRVRRVAGRRESGYDWGMDDDTYECPQCGARVYPEMTRCPQCGHNMYPEDEEGSGVLESQSEAGGWGSLLGSLFVGWITAAGIALVVHFIIASFAAPGMLGTAGTLFLLLGGPLGALAGGYLCSSIGKQRPLLLGALVGVLAIPVLLLLATHWVQVTLAVVFSPLMLVEWVLTVLAGVAGGWLSTIMGASSQWQERWKMRSWEDFLYQDLLRKVRFNGSAADRLIEYERRQDPQATRFKLIQNAIERWERDNR